MNQSSPTPSSRWINQVQHLNFQGLRKLESIKSNTFQGSRNQDDHWIHEENLYPITPKSGVDGKSLKTFQVVKLPWTNGLSWFIALGNLVWSKIWGYSSSRANIRFIEIPIDSGMGLSITIDKLRVFINKTLSTQSLINQLLIKRVDLSISIDSR